MAHKTAPLDIPPDLVRALGIKSERGWTGAFSRYTYPDCLPNGTRIEKSLGTPGDTHSLGAKGTVLGAIRVEPNPVSGYFVEWDDTPRHAVFVSAEKLQPLRKAENGKGEEGSGQQTSTGTVTRQHPEKD